MMQMSWGTSCRSILTKLSRQAPKLRWSLFIQLHFHWKHLPVQWNILIQHWKAPGVPLSRVGPQLPLSRKRIVVPTKQSSILQASASSCIFSRNALFCSSAVFFASHIRQLEGSFWPRIPCTSKEEKLDELPQWSQQFFLAARGLILAKNTMHIKRRKTGWTATMKSTISCALRKTALVRDKAPQYHTVSIMLIYCDTSQDQCTCPE